MLVRACVCVREKDGDHAGRLKNIGGNKHTERKKKHWREGRNEKVGDEGKCLG